MHRKTLAIIAFVVVSIVAVGCRPAAAPVTVGNKPISVNGVRADDAPGEAWKPVAEMNWSTFDGKVQKVKDFQGKVILLDFWATYCKPCLEAIPHLRQLQAKYPNDLQVIGLHVGGEEDRPKVPEFAEKLQIDYPMGTPEDDLTRFVFGNDTAIPQTAIFGRDGKFVRKIVGFNDEIQKELDAAIEAAIAR